MFNHRLEHQGRTRGFLIETRAAGGWDVLEEQDRRVVREVHYDDWHRVERQLNVFAMRVEILKNEGWVPVGADTARSACGTPAAPASRLLDEAIAETDRGLDLPAGRSELGAQPSDVDVDRSRLDQPIVAPHALEQPLARQHAVAVLDQALQQLELAPRQADAGAVDGDGHGVEVGDDLPAAIDRLGVGGRALAAAAAAPARGPRARAG